MFGQTKALKSKKLSDVLCANKESMSIRIQSLRTMRGGQWLNSLIVWVVPSECKEPIGNRPIEVLSNMKFIYSVPTTMLMHVQLASICD
ncbi:MAG: hypothetical protein EBQ57_00400 [Actinobacteria bacterium]|nr:hypothetical protein [Actinomycetota bacterium]